MVSHPREWKKSSTFSCSQFLPTYFMAGFSVWVSQANKCQVRVRGQKQRRRDRCAVFHIYKVRWMSAQAYMHVSTLMVCIVFWKAKCMCQCVYMCVVLGYSGRWNHAPPCTGSPWLVLMRIADHINATPPPHFFSLAPAICTFKHSLPDIINPLQSYKTQNLVLGGAQLGLPHTLLAH